PQVAPQDYQNVPIDIQTSKLLDWLLDRRHCSVRWQSQAQLIREKIQAALQDMPENQEIKELLERSYLHYFHCLRIVEILKGTEASTKNLFGRYSSQRMKDWQEIVSLYEKENTYLAELSSLLTRSISYEIPSLKKQLGRCQQAQQELLRREDECQLGAGELRERFLASCRQYGIAGSDVRQELLSQVQALPSLLSQVGDSAATLAEAIELYQACVGFGLGMDKPQMALLGGFGDRDGQTPDGSAGWFWGLAVAQGDLGSLFPQIDWGDFPAESPQGGDIDWGITVEPEPQGDDGIDWGDGGGQEGTREGTITVVEAGTEGEWGLGSLSGHPGGIWVPWGDTERVWGDTELELFLAQRLLELEDEADVVAMSQLQLAPAVLQGQSSERVRAQLAAARQLLAQLCSRSVQHLCMILASPRYVERVSALLKQKLLQAELLLAKKDTLGQRRQQALEEQRALEPKLQRLQERTRELQKLIEADISKRYGGRPVNLMGINV
ncbi:CK5P3 protein, partial [Grantiella picta]|nr:CK5P3 protein [Grantiella picta]